MHAVVGIWTMEADRWVEQQQALHQHIVPMVRQSLGFAAGYWMGDQAAGRTYTTIVLQDEEAARCFKAFVEGNVASQEGAGVIPGHSEYSQDPPPVICAGQLLKERR